MQYKNTKNQTMTSFHNSTEQFIQKAVTNINKIKVYDNSVQNSESLFFFKKLVRTHWMFLKHMDGVKEMSAINI